MVKGYEQSIENNLVGPKHTRNAGPSHVIFKILIKFHWNSTTFHLSGIDKDKNILKTIRVKESVGKQNSHIHA